MPLPDTPPKPPMQPLYIDKFGRPAFRENAIVDRLLEIASQHGFSLNEIVSLTYANRFSPEDLVQLYQLIGYSLDGYAELSFIPDDEYKAAAEMAENPDIDERDARIATLTAELEALREGMRDAVARLYGIHPDDLKGGAS